MKCRDDLFENRKIISKLYFQPNLDIKTVTYTNDTKYRVIFVAVEKVLYGLNSVKFSKFLFLSLNF